MFKFKIILGNIFKANNSIRGLYNISAIAPTSILSLGLGVPHLAGGQTPAGDLEFKGIRHVNPSNESRWVITFLCMCFTKLQNSWKKKTPFFDGIHMDSMVSYSFHFKGPRDLDDIVFGWELDPIILIL